MNSLSQKPGNTLPWSILLMLKNCFKQIQHRLGPFNVKKKKEREKTIISWALKIIRVSYTDIIIGQNKSLLLDLSPCYHLTILPVDESIILSALTFFITQTAAITNLIASGGFFIDFTKVISVGFKVFNAATASIKIIKFITSSVLVLWKIHF